VSNFVHTDTQFGTILGENGYSSPAQIVRSAAYLADPQGNSEPRWIRLAHSTAHPMAAVSNPPWTWHLPPKQGRANIHLTLAQNLSKYWDEQSVAAISA